MKLEFDPHNKIELEGVYEMILRMMKIKFDGSIKIFIPESEEITEDLLKNDF